MVKIMDWRFEIQTIIWANVALVYWRTYASLLLNVLTMLCILHALKLAYVQSLAKMTIILVKIIYAYMHISFCMIIICHAYNLFICGWYNYLYFNIDISAFCLNITTRLQQTYQTCHRHIKEPCPPAFPCIATLRPVYITANIQLSLSTAMHGLVLWFLSHIHWWVWSWNKSSFSISLSLWNKVLWTKRWLQYV